MLLLVFYLQLKQAAASLALKAPTNSQSTLTWITVNALEPLASDHVLRIVERKPQVFMCNTEKWVFHNFISFQKWRRKIICQAGKDFEAFPTDLPLAKVFFVASIELLFAVYGKLLVILTLFISCILQQYDWYATSIATVAAASLLLILLYNRPLWRLNTLFIL